MEIRPVPLDQIVAGRDGRQYEVSGHAGRIVQRLQQEVDESIIVHFNELQDGGFFVVSQVIPEGPRAGREEVVLRVRSDEWDERVIKDLEVRFYEMRNGINPCDRLEALEDAHAARMDYEFEQDTRAVASKLFHSLQREVVGIRPRVFMPRAIATAA